MIALATVTASAHSGLRSHGIPGGIGKPVLISGEHANTDDSLMNIGYPLGYHSLPTGLGGSLTTV